MSPKGKTVRKVVIGAAGRGTRFLPITSVIPKEMLPIIDRPLLEYVLEEAIVSGIEEIILVISKSKKFLLDYLKSSKVLPKNINVKVLYQNDEVYGDAVPVLLASKYLTNEPFLVLWADSFGLKKYSRVENLLKAYKKYAKPIISLIPISPEETFLYAVPDVDRKDGKIIIKRLLEKPGLNAPSLFAAPNGFILEPSIFKYLKSLSPNPRSGELSLIDAIDNFCRENLVYGLVFDKPFFEAGNKVDYVKTTVGVALEREDINENVRKKLSLYCSFLPPK